MLMAQKEWQLNPFPSPSSNWVLDLLHFAESLGEKCYVLLEGNELEHQRTYMGFGEGWVLTPATWQKAQPPDPLEHLRSFRAENFPAGNSANFVNPASGIMGYLDYEWGLLWQKPKATTAKPGYFFRLCPINLVLLPSEKKVILEVFSQEKAQLEQNYHRWSTNLERWLKEQEYPSTQKLLIEQSKHEKSHKDQLPKVLAPAPWKPNMSQNEFLSKVQRIKEYIRAGDIFQAVLSQRFTLKRTVDPWQTYARLRLANPSPWLFCVFGEKETLVGSSPELLLSTLGNRIQTRPIAGTRPRGKTFEEDKALEQELLQDTKELAEHAMLVDLGRNDLGRVCRYGSVKVSDYCTIQRFSHVMHIVSTVEGELAPACDSLAALQAVLPAGTLSGAPKVRAMEILQELEPQRRGPYGGALGIYRWNGDLDFCITIRTLCIRKDEVSVQSGAGIVYDSLPQREYEETLHKANALFQVVKAKEVPHAGCLR